ncbi:MAG: putative reverse transcriptase, partial [Streblomastix strix]
MRLSFIRLCALFDISKIKYHLIIISGSQRSASDRVIQRYRRKPKRRRKDQSAESERYIESSPQQRHSKHRQSKHKKRNKKIKHNAARKRQHILSEYSSSDSSTVSSSQASTDDDIVHNELRKIIGDSISQYKPLDFKFSATRIENDIRAVAPDKIDFLTEDPPPKWEGHDDEDAAESVILSAATTRSVLLMANVAAESPETWQKLKKPIMRTFRLSQQTTTHAQAARESLVQTKKVNIQKQQLHLQELFVTQSLQTQKREAYIRKAFLRGTGAKLDSQIARLETQSQQELRVETWNSQMEEKSEEIGGRLMRFREVWTAIGAERQVMMGIMPLWTNENSKQILKNISHLTQPQGYLLQFHLLLQEEIRQKIVIYVNPLYVKLFSPTFCIPKRDGSYRKILDARVINELIKKIHFKMISPFDVQQALLKDSYLTSSDIKSAFNHITVHPSLQPYLGFQVEDRSFVYIGMPFGLRLAPIVFTKTLQMALAAIKKGLSSTILQYSDDILIINQNPLESSKETQLVKNQLQKFSWIINNKKSEMEPKKEIRYLGWIWNTEEMIVKMPQDRQIKLLSDLMIGKIDCKVTIPQIPISTGIISSNQVELPKGKSNSQTRMGFDSSTQAYNLVRALLVTAILTTDASRTGWGAVLKLEQSELLQASTWKKPMNLRSSNQREASAILQALRKFKLQLAGIDQLTVQTDNQVAVMNLQRKASAAPLATTMRLIFQEAVQMGFSLHAVHIKGVDNRTKYLTTALLQLGLTQQEDMFATKCNAKCTIYYSPTQEEAAAGTGGLQAVWSNKTVHINPSLTLMGKVVQKLRTVSNCTAVVIAMDWLKSMVVTTTVDHGIRLDYSGQF